MLTRDEERLHPGLTSCRQQLGQGRKEPSAQVADGHVQLGVGGRQRDREVLAPLDAGRLRSVKHPLHWRANPSSEGVIEYMTVVDDMQVHDRGGAESRQARAVNAAARGQQSRRAVMRDGENHRVGSERRHAVDLDAKAIVPGHDRGRTPAQAHIYTGPGKRSPRGDVVDLPKGHMGIAHVTSGRIAQ